jgi:hypothetical protein
LQKWKKSNALIVVSGLSCIQTMALTQRHSATFALWTIVLARLVSVM